ncbi:MAG TPA: hypothetical protein VGC11_16695 [Acidimicrobiia bacterium]|jgi:hypothetical protein
MRIRIVATFVGLSLVAACGGGVTPATTAEPAAEATTTTVLAAAPTTVAPATTLPTTTMEPPTTTTTELPAASGDILAGLLAGTDIEATSGRFSGVIRFVAEPGGPIPDDAVMTIEGAYDDTVPASSLSMDFGTLFEAMAATDASIPPGMRDLFAEPMEMVSIGSTVYIRWGLFAMFLGPDVEWVSFDEETAGDFTSSFTFGADASSPLATLDQLAGAGAVIDDLGEEEVRGVTTTHYQLQVDLQGLAAELSAEEQADLEEAFGSTDVAAFPIDLYIGEDGRLYRYEFSMTMPADSPDSEGIAGIVMTFDMYDYDADIVIDPPPADEVTSGEELGDLFSL